jgi:hypothetical protein
MPSLIATPVATPTDKEHELEQEFELDIRVSSTTALPTLVKFTDYFTCHTCKTQCGSCMCSYTCTCYTCGRSCSCPTCYCCP